MIAQAISPAGELLPEETIYQTLAAALEGRFAGARVLVLIPDFTRSIPLPRLFRLLVKLLRDAQKLDFMVALGTHPRLEETALRRLVGLSKSERETTFKGIGLLNHEWQDDDALIQIATLAQEQIEAIAGDDWHPSLGGDLPVRINRRLFDYDEILILGPTFPHEVVGFSGGAKYLFPGVSGPEMIDVTHWLGALRGVVGTIGLADTPVRDLIHLAAGHVATPVTLVALVVAGGGLSGLFVGDLFEAWREAAVLSARRHIRWFDRPFHRILSTAPPMYEELWTAAKAMYKLEPVLARGGELIIYAPHLEAVSQVHGRHIFEVGYHVLPYFLKQWDRFRHVPRGVLAHSTHVRGGGRFEVGVELANAKVILASKIPEADCRRLGLGYLDPENVDVREWQDREDEGVLYVPKAGEILYRLRAQASGVA